jgi:hypothetical protein
MGSTVSARPELGVNALQRSGAIPDAKLLLSGASSAALRRGPKEDVRDARNAGNQTIYVNAGTEGSYLLTFRRGPRGPSPPELSLPPGEIPPVVTGP